MMRWKRTTPSIAANCSSILILLSFSLLTGGCTFFQPAPQFSYTIETAGVVPGSPPVSEVTVDDQCVDIHVEFEGGGGDNDIAKLHQKNSQLSVQFLNTDHKSFKTLVLYRFAGKICGLEPDEYTLIIEDSNDRVVLEKRFTIKSP